MANAIDESHMHYDLESQALVFAVVAGAFVLRRRISPQGWRAFQFTAQAAGGDGQGAQGRKDQGGKASFHVHSLNSGPALHG